MNNGVLATFAAGCFWRKKFNKLRVLKVGGEWELNCIFSSFWGVQHYFKKQFGPAIISSRVGYTGGDSLQTDYRQVCSGATGHAEAVEFTFDPTKVKYEDLVTYFWRIHDPTTVNRQGNDRGTQYRSAVFYHSEDQKTIAEKVKAQVQSHFKSPIVTEIVPAQHFISAEGYHQNYLDNNPGGYCNHKLQW